MPQPDALKSFLSQAGVALAPLRTIDSQQRAVTFFRQLGYDFPSSAFGGALQDLASAAGNMATTLQSLATASSDEARNDALIELLRQVIEMVRRIDQLHDQLQSNEYSHD